MLIQIGHSLLMHWFYCKYISFFSIDVILHVLCYVLLRCLPEMSLNCFEINVSYKVLTTMYMVMYESGGQVIWEMIN